MTTTSGPRVDPAPLFDRVTGFPPDDALDLTMPMPLALAIYMTMLESTGRAAELAAVRRIHIEQVRETACGMQAGVDDLAGPDLPESARLRVTHIIEERVPGVNGLRPHVHMFIGTTVRCPGGDPERPVDVERLDRLAEAEIYPDHRDRLLVAIGERCGVVWGESTPAGRDVLIPGWLARSAAHLADQASSSCSGPWPRRQIEPARPR